MQLPYFRALLKARSRFLGYDRPPTMASLGIVFASDMLTDATRVLLNRIGLFEGLPPEALNSLWAGSKVRQINQGDFVFQQGEAAQSVYVLLSGRVRLVQHSAYGKDVTLATFVEGDLIGLVAALSDDAYPASAEVLSDSEILITPHDRMWDLMRQYPELTLRALMIITSRLHEAHERIRELSVERVQQRIARAIVRLAHKTGVKQPDGSLKLDIRLSRQDLAQMTGTTLETVSRTLTTWEKTELVEAGRESLIILNPHQLMLIAEDLVDP